MPVPPPVIRPSLIIDESQSKEDDLSVRLCRIIEINDTIKKKKRRDKSVDSEDWNALQVEVGAFIDSDVYGDPAVNDNQESLAGIKQRLKGLEGRFRGSLSGKYVKFSGRTVISPDPNLSITEVAIPEKMTSGLTSVKIKRKELAHELKCGDIVQRRLEDGDVVLINKQPSTHRMSIMCHKARIIPGRTMRFNQSVCKPYNARFDGGVMTIHVPQTEKARAEANLLMGVENNLCTSANGEILVASPQDFLTTSFLITRKDTFYDRATFCLICSYMGDAMEHIDMPIPAVIKSFGLESNFLASWCAQMQM
ncbi:DNA-directed RNA pol I, largest subunit [Trema orientale]|uniref:DNA-directed RNA polymerase subunit n=1 Tax=Trema orientale TaxID=63057 RepID=A0A2P5DJ35_TREOI|nr:DNA-directed RNA pol I, largest subunit [Trema orientale]